jgi:YjbE family integral membrane protein
MLEILGAIGGIVLVDLALSGDNALVIGAAASGLPAHQRRRAILLGGGGAIALRMIFAVAATLLLQLPLLQAAGGALLLWIAYRLLAGRDEKTSDVDARAGDEGEKKQSAAAGGFGAALLTILLADVTMSLDNVLAVGALAAGHLPLLAAGLLLSMGLVLVGSAVVATLIRRLPWLLDVAALVLGWTAANMALHDLRLGPILDQWAWSGLVVHAAGVGVVLAVDVALRLRARARAGAATAGGAKAGAGQKVATRS